jgi:hypothetical protein
MYSCIKYCFIIFSLALIGSCGDNNHDDVITLQDSIDAAKNALEINAQQSEENNQVNPERLNGNLDAKVNGEVFQFTGETAVTIEEPYDSEYSFKVKFFDKSSNNILLSFTLDSTLFDKEHVFRFSKDCEVSKGKPSGNAKVLYVPEGDIFKAVDCVKKDGELTVGIIDKEKRTISGSFKLVVEKGESALGVNKSFSIEGIFSEVKY